jgi:hypothetical protein
MLSAFAAGTTSHESPGEGRRWRHRRRAAHTGHRQAIEERIALDLGGVKDQRIPAFVGERRVRKVKAVDGGTDGTEHAGHSHPVKKCKVLDLRGVKIQRIPLFVGERRVIKVELAADGSAGGPQHTGHLHATEERIALDATVKRDQSASCSKAQSSKCRPKESRRSARPAVPVM